MNKDTTDVGHLNEADKSESVLVQGLAGFPLAVPSSREYGWPPAAKPPTNIHEWEALQPVIQCAQCRKLSKQFELSSDQRRYIDQQLHSNSREVHKPRTRNLLAN